MKRCMVVSAAGLGALALMGSGVLLAGAQTTTATGSVTVTANNTSSFILPWMPSATSTMPMHQQVNLPSQLQVGPDGNFMARNLIVQSVSGNSFTASVWGVTYTVNVGAAPAATANTGTMMPEFLLRSGKGGGQFDMSQVQVGDQLGVQGRVSTGSPLVVTANVVRNYSLTTARRQGEDGQHPPMMGQPGMMGPAGTSTGTSTRPAPRLEDLMRQFQELQHQLQQRGGGQGQQGQGGSTGPGAQVQVQGGAQVQGQ